MPASRAHEPVARPNVPLGPPEPANDVGTAHDMRRNVSTCQEVASCGPPLFSALELLVIGVGKRDPLTRIERGSRLARARRLLFGIETPRPFADKRLEALRSLTLAFRRRRGAATETAAALFAGITQRQIERLEALI